MTSKYTWNQFQAPGIWVWNQPNLSLQSQRVSIEDPSIGGQRWHTSPKGGNQWQLPQLLQLLLARPSFFPWSTASKPWLCRIWVLEICITSDLLGLECISPSLFPLLKLLEPRCIVLKSFLLMTAKYSAISAANSLTCGVLFWGRSLM